MAGSHTRHISPHGTARRRFAHLAGERQGDRLERLFARLAASVRAHDLDDESLFFAEELARMQPVADPSQELALALAVLCSQLAVRQGSTRLPLACGSDAPAARLVSSILAGAQIEADPAQILREIENLAKLPPDSHDRIIAATDCYLPLLLLDGCLYQQRMYRNENALVERLCARIDAPPAVVAAAPPPAQVEAALQALERSPSRVNGREVRLSQEQSLAVRRACERPLTLITGGPGTGKTAIVVSILRAARHLGTRPEEIALAGPTGKAANRMAQSVARSLESIAGRTPADESLLSDGPAPRTLHRLLGFMPASGRFRHHENSPIAASLVVVDEASMIDLELMDRLLRATGPRARLVLLGDAEQLPSVDAGAVFRDLVAAIPAHTVRLTQSYRMRPDDPAGSHVLRVAAAINAGKAPLPLTPPAQGGVCFADTRGNPGAALNLAEDWARKRYIDHPRFAELAARTYHFHRGAIVDGDRGALAELFSHHEHSRLLTVTRRFATGSEAVNARLGQLIAQRVSPSGSRRSDLRPGEPLLMLRNDYDRGLFNGDQGVVALVSEDDASPRLRAVFPRSAGSGFASHHLDSLRPSIERAYALTVHKSQGSEFDRVTVLLPVVDLPLLSREMLYTAITRARTAVVIAGTEALLRAAAARSVERYSGIADQLRKRFSA